METSLIILVVGLWTMLGAIVGTFGTNRTIGFTGTFFASIFLSPILAMLFVLASDKTTKRNLTGGEKALIIMPIILIVSYFIGRPIINKQLEKIEIGKQIIVIQSLTLNDLEGRKEIDCQSIRSEEGLKHITIYSIPSIINSHYIGGTSYDEQIKNEEDLEKWKQNKIRELQSEL